MMKHIRLFSFLLMLLSLIMTTAFSMGKNENYPMKPYKIINIPDGEYLHYESFVGGEKEIDLYFVTKRVINENGDLFYYSHYDMVKIADKADHSEDYREWPMLMVIDPKTGAVMRSEAKLKPADDDKIGSIFGQGGMVYWNYVLYPEKGYVEYISKSEKDGEISQATYKIKFDTSYPSTDALASMFFVPRYLDPQTGGLLYLIMPDFMKEPLAFTLKYVSEKSLETEAGSFKVRILTGSVADPFIQKLMGSITKQYIYSVEISDRKLVVNLSNIMGDIILKEIGQVE